MNTLTLVFALLVAQTASDPDRITIPFKDPARPGTVEVRLFQGNLTIAAYGGRDVIVTSKSRRSRISVNADVQGLRRLTAGGFAVAEENNVVSVRGDAFEKVDLGIQVPATTNLKIQSSFGGSVAVTGIEGDIEVTNLDGAVTLKDVAGSVVTHSMNGSVMVTMKKVAAEKPMAFTSVNGNVDVTLPADTRANLKLRTTLGDIYTDFDVQISSPQLRSLDTPPGRHPHMNFERAITGTINGGGPDFELRTMNGNLFIRKAK
jgi:putative adhesin